MVEHVARENMETLVAGDTLELRDGTVRVLFSAQEIRERVAVLGRAVARDLGEKRPVLIGILRGGFVFLSDLSRTLGKDHELDFLQVSLYDPRDKDPTAVKILHDLRSNVRDRDIVVVEGIRTSGTKMEYVRDFLALHRPASLSFAALVCQAVAREHKIPLHYKGFDIDNEFVVGCGLDYGEKYRNLPFTGALTLRPPESPLR